MEKLLRVVLLLLVAVACSSAQTDGLSGNSLQCMVNIASCAVTTIYRERTSVAATAHAYTTVAFINCTTKITIYKMRTEMLFVL